MPPPARSVGTHCWEQRGKQREVRPLPTTSASPQGSSIVPCDSTTDFAQLRTSHGALPHLWSYLCLWLCYYCNSEDSRS
ncbi:hypothetical protein E2C01_046271 [Portunus trituberculatus]|uniref:Uncharacterized protein n=1 Tax=Portunus trituberculatus TaxID=210409 RepID=A0A5B7G590_PORTR|nr:hypothetical protein [Portunus trituberculatus]